MVRAPARTMVVTERRALARSPAVGTRGAGRPCLGLRELACRTAIARRNLPRADAPTAAVLHCVLARSLNGQGRHDEALAEVRHPTSPDSADIGAVDINTAAALHGLGRRPEAEATARQGLTVRDRSLP
ncbi:hypothetical protein ACJA3G_02145, partial [Streptomyces sp. YS-3]